MTLCPATPVCGEIVIDTNCVLDLWVFQDAGMTPLRAALAQGAVRWRARVPLWKASRPRPPCPATPAAAMRSP